MIKSSPDCISDNFIFSVFPFASLVQHSHLPLTDYQICPQVYRNITPGKYNAGLLLIQGDYFMLLFPIQFFLDVTTAALKHANCCCLNISHTLHRTKFVLFSIYKNKLWQCLLFN